MLIWKSFLTVCVYILLGATAILGDQNDANSLAATFALVGSAVLFVSLIPYKGKYQRLVVLPLGLAGGFSAFWAGWFWLDIGKNDVGNLIIIPAGVLLIIIAVVVTPLVATLDRAPSKHDED